MPSAGPRVGPALVVPGHLQLPLRSSPSPSPLAPLLPPALGKGEAAAARGWRGALGASWREPLPPHLSPGARPDQVLALASTGSRRLEPECVCGSSGAGRGPFSRSGCGTPRSWVGRRPVCMSMEGFGQWNGEAWETPLAESFGWLAGSRLRGRRPLGSRRRCRVWKGSLPPKGLALKGGASSEAKRRVWTAAGWLGQFRAPIARSLRAPRWDGSGLRGLRVGWALRGAALGGARAEEWVRRPPSNQLPCASPSSSFTALLPQRPTGAVPPQWANISA